MSSLKESLVVQDESILGTAPPKIIPSLMVLKEKNIRDDILCVIRPKKTGEEPESTLQGSGVSTSYGETPRLFKRISVGQRADSIYIEESNEDIIRGLLWMLGKRDIAKIFSLNFIESIVSGSFFSFFPSLYSCFIIAFRFLALGAVGSLRDFAFSS